MILKEHAKKWLENPTSQDIKRRTMEAIPFWIAAAIASSFAVGYAVIFSYVEHLAMMIFHENSLWFFLVSPLAFLGSWGLVRRYAPEAVGSGIPQLIAALELNPEKDKAWLDRLLGLKTAAIKTVSSLVGALGGGIIGREGPTLQISGSVFHTVRKLLPISAKATHSSMTVAGAAAGLAAAFNTPLGGIVYVVEELAKVHLSNFRTAVLQAVLVAGLIAQLLSGPYLYLGFPSLASTPASFLGICVLVGAVTGLAGALFGQALLKVAALSRNRKLWQNAMIAVVSGLLFATSIYFVGEHAMGSGKHVLLDLLFRDQSSNFPEALARVFGSILTYAAGGAGGIFAPSLAAGATIGSLFQAWMPYPAPHLLVLIGMVGFLTGVTHTPFTSFVLVLEMTDRHSSIFFLMIAAVVSHAVSRTVSQKSFYELASERFLAPPGTPHIASEHP
jgi:H+/Cl- antiporter ClcA